MNAVDFPSLSRTNLSHKKDVVSTLYVPRHTSNSKPVTIVATSAPISTKEAWMLNCENIQSGRQAFNPSFFWGFQTPLLFSTYEQSFRSIQTNIGSVRELGKWLKPITHDIRIPLVHSCDEEEEEGEVEVVIERQTLTPEQRLMELGIKPSHITPLLTYIAFVCA